MDHVIVVKNLKKHYNKGKVKALNGLSFELTEGKVYGLIGPNGAGKTTLVKSLLGAISPTEGEVTIYGTYAGSTYANEQIGYVCEKNALPLNEDPYEYLTTMALLSKIKIKDSKDKIISYLEQFGLKEFMFHKMKKFSSGMKKKVQIISALLSDPRILILDEPTANLDPKARYEIFNFIKKTALNEKITVVLCSHNLFELEKIVDNILMIKKGRLLIQGSYVEIIERIKGRNRLQIKSSNDNQLIELLDTLENCQTMKSSPIIVETDDLTALKEKVIEFAYLNKIVINELIEVKDSLFELFDYFNEEKGGETNATA